MRTRLEKTGKAAALALLSSITLASSIALADDAKVYTAAMCEPYGANSGHKIDYGISGIAKNTSSGRIFLVCPIVRDVLNKPVERVHIVVDQRNPNQDTSCYFKALYSNGAAYYTKTMRTSGTGLQTISFFDPPCSGNCIGSPPGLAYTFYCSVPGKSGGQATGISQYTVYEDS